MTLATRKLFAHILAILCCAFGAPRGVVAAPDCPANFAIDFIHSNGSRWEMCWAPDPKKGMALSQVAWTPRNGSRTLVLAYADLAQVYTAEDDGSMRRHAVSDGGLPLLPLTASDCPNGNLLNDANGTARVCQSVLPRGYAWRGTRQIQGQGMVIFAISAAGNDAYVHQWIFDEAGTIQPMLGVTGSLDTNRFASAATGWPLRPGGAWYAANRSHAAYWRLDFALGGQDGDLFQQLQYTDGTTLNTRAQAITSHDREGQFTINPDNQRFWVVKDKVLTNRDGHSISYEIVPHHTSVYRGSEPFTAADVFITQQAPCEQFASHNPVGVSGCAEELSAYTNDELINDLVVWAGSSWHQVPRAEDEVGMAVHWLGLTLAPRDVSATSPLL